MMMTPKLRLGSRRSRLALWQTHAVARALTECHPGLEVEVITMDTLGDKLRDMPLPAIGAKGLFTQELEQALLAHEVDLVVHSLKDLPTTLPTGLAYAGALRRADPTDALIAPRLGLGQGLIDLPEGAVIATGSVRRRAQLLHRRPDLRFEDLRGNIDTRLRKLEENGWDAIVMASAALDRLERPDLTTSRLQPPDFVPAVAQGAIGLEIREGREDIQEMLGPILHRETMEAVGAERLFMRSLEGGCAVPLAAHCRRLSEGAGWVFWAWVSSLDGRHVLFDELRGGSPQTLAQTALEQFVANGAHAMLREARHHRI